MIFSILAVTQGRSAALTPCLHRAEAMAFRKELNIFNILLFVIGILVLGFLEVIVADQAQESDTAEKVNIMEINYDTLSFELHQRELKWCVVSTSFV